MRELPYHYKVGASAEPERDAALSCDQLDTIPFASPAEFGGPGNRWSPNLQPRSGLALRHRGYAWHVTTRDLTLKHLCGPQAPVKGRFWRRRPWIGSVSALDMR